MPNETWPYDTDAPIMNKMTSINIFELNPVLNLVPPEKFALRCDFVAFPRIGYAKLAIPTIRQRLYVAKNEWLFGHRSGMR
jgi:hypothetical protein